MFSDFKILSREDADETYFCIRRVPPIADSYFKHPIGLKVGCFKDFKDETSVELFSKNLTIEEAKDQYKSYIEDRGFGLCIAQVKSINDSLRNNNVLVEESDYSDEKGVLGVVKKDPIPETPNHAVIIGKERITVEGENKKLRKGALLSQVFADLIVPKMLKT